MNIVYPSYYSSFKCIASKCRHNCCIGWGIDIDEDSAEYYKSVTGEMGERFKQSISYDGTAHFILAESERCPFLNKDNLCDIIINCGEEHLCTICEKHPRFENELPDRIETGIGMTCEEAARLILSQKEKVTLLCEEDTSDEIITLRNKVLSVLQNREKSIPDRIIDMLSLCDATLPQKSPGEWADTLLSLERLDEEWTDMLTLLKKNTDTSTFDAHMHDRQTEYEQMLVYFIYRHFANAPDTYEASLRASFAALAYTVIHALGAAVFAKTGKFTFENQTELCRMFSSEIEYSDENLYVLLDVIAADL